MNRIKKILFSMIIIVMVILGSYTVLGAVNVTQAYRLKKGDNFTLESHQAYLNCDSLLCVEFNQHLKDTKMNFEVIQVLEITGKTAVDADGKTTTSKANAKLAYILTAETALHPRQNKENNPTCNALWSYMSTWVRNVGVTHGVYRGFASSATNRPDLGATIYNNATTYANNIDAKIKETQITDNTNKSNIKVVPHEKDGTQYFRIGPFNWTFSGTIKGITVQNQSQQNISNIKISKFSGSNEIWNIALSAIESGKDFYISVPANSSATRITKISGTVKGEGQKSVKIWFLKDKEPETNGDLWQNLILRQIKNDVPIENTTSITYNIPISANLEIIKVDEDTQNKKLSGVGFIIQNKDTGKYVKNTSNVISYVDRANATEFVTDSEGKITVTDLVLGNYIAYETKNPNYGYQLKTEGVEIALSANKSITITNKQKYIKLSGYVWVDKIDGKTSSRNDLYKTNEHPNIGDYVDGEDILLNGVTVRLKEKSTGNTIKETTTANGGEYTFGEVLIEELSDYYIEFEYDGLTYTNVVAHNDKDTGSKAVETQSVRESFNKGFSVVEGSGQSTGFTRDENGNKKYDLSYNIDQNAHTATLINNGQYKITANTEATSYSIKDHYVQGQEEIRNINLGLYEREMPNIAVVKDLQNVKVTVNGYEHIYNYAQRFVNEGEYGDGFNVGVKFGEKYGNMSYSRAIYKADYEYENASDSSKELKVYLTYKIAMKNTSDNLVVQVNSLVDYFDSRYTITKVGTGIGDNGSITGDISKTESTYNEKYKKVIINNNMKIEPQRDESVYVQFELSREQVQEILEDEGASSDSNKIFDNVAEINSYSVFDKDQKVYAGIDKNSNPGNCVPGDKTTYEDDTDSSPALKLETAGAREIAGKVFLDSTTGELKTGEIRQGSGAYEEGEKGIAGVEVTLTENTGTGKIYKATTDENGDYVISGFMPGEYTLTYTWGDETYTVQSYKGTVYDNSRDQTDKKWWYVKTKEDGTKEEAPRLSDAIDNYETRQQIDAEIEQATSKTTTTINKMTSTTPEMEIGVEYETAYTASTGDRYTYRIENIDFGIVERARQDLALTKRIKTLKVTLPNGQVITDVTIDENGKITGENKHLTHMKPSNTTIPENGFVKLELDNELIQGSLLEVGYEIKATNISEVDYLTEDYYKYGIEGGEVATIEPTAIIDYLDSDWSFDISKNQGWTIKKLAEIKDIVAETVYNNPNTTINEKTILYTENLKQKLTPNTSTSTMLNVSKTLSTSDEISLDNETELVKADKNGGSKLSSTPGNYVPGKGSQESDDSIAETLIITPNTGNNLNYIIPITLGITALIILGAGIVFIKKKILNED